MYLYYLECTISIFHFYEQCFAIQEVVVVGDDVGVVKDGQNVNLILRVSSLLLIC